MDLASIQAALTTIIGTASGGLKVSWEEEPRSMVTAPRVLLNLISTGAIGVDEQRPEFDDPFFPGDLTARVVGLRPFTLSIQVENSQTQKPTGKAQLFLERIRTRLRFPSAHEALKAAGIALVSLGPTVLLDHDYDDHRVSRASMDAFMTTSVDEKDDSAALGFIETIEVTSEVEDPGGTVLPTPPNLDEEVMP
jgi:hypothetical protein